MKRIIILGRGGSGKSTLAKELSTTLDLPHVELDKHFWQDDLKHPSTKEWTKIQEQLASANEWIMDGDLGPYDELSVRLGYADTVILLDYSFARCMLRAMGRSRERFDFWVWVFNWRRKSKPKILKDIQTYAPKADLHIFRSPKELDRFIGNFTS